MVNFCEAESIEFVIIGPEAPLAAGQPIAELKINLGGEEVLRTPLRALDDNPIGSFWQRAKDSVSLLFE